MVTFIAHLNVTIKHLTRYKQELVLAAMLEGKSMPSNMAANTNHTILLKIKVHRGYYTGARRYEFYFRVAKQYFTNERSE